MFDIGFMELLLISVITLVVMGPQRLPQAVRTITLWLGRARQAFSAVRKELEDEVGMDDIKRQLHNEQVLRDLKSNKSELEDVLSTPVSPVESTEDKRSSNTHNNPPNNDSDNKPESDESPQ
jgi:sec-independent protein translocase protein TatB